MAKDKKDVTSSAASKRQQRKLEQQRAERRKRLLMIVGGVVAVAIVAVLVLIVVNNRGDSSDLPEVQAFAAPDASIPANGMTIGDPNAPVKIVEYGDYQCPYCAAFNNDAMPILLSDYIASGQVQLTFIPFSFLGDESFAAAEAAFCANDQGKFWAMHESIYGNHSVEENIGNLSESRLQEMAKNSGLDMDQYNACIDAGTHEGDVQNSNATARQAGIASTPSFVINNGDPIGYETWDDFKAEIDAALGNA